MLPHLQHLKLLLLCTSFLFPKATSALPTDSRNPASPLYASKAAPRWQTNNTFDYIIVGGGTSGLALADRLSETASVVVVEAGIDYLTNPLAAQVVSVPALATQGNGADPNAPANQLFFDWGFVTTPQKDAGNRTVHYSRGKVLGGTSTRNFMIYQRGSKQSYDIWAKLNDRSWSWDGLLPYFEKSVNYLPPDNDLRRLDRPTPPDPALMKCAPSPKPSRLSRRQTPISSSDVISVPQVPTVPGPPQPSSTRPPTLEPPKLFGKGPVSLSVPPFAQAFGAFMIGAMIELGLKEIVSFNDGSILGIQFCVSTIQQAFGRVARSTSRTSYVREAEECGRENVTNPRGGRLTVLTGAFVERILFEGTSTKAIGVVFSDASTDTSVLGISQPPPQPVQTALYATREVIISAGAFQSPQLLMVSGIGPKATLEQHGIKTLVDLPGVGQGMEDHVFFGPTYPVSVETFSKLADNFTFQSQQLSNFSLNRLGPFTNPVSDVIGFEVLDDEVLKTIGADSLIGKLPADFPHLEYIISPAFPGNFSVTTKNPSTPLEPVGQQYATILATVVAPQSRGTVSISSSSMLDPPIIDPNWLSSPIDQAIAIAGFRRTRQAWSTNFMGQILQGEEIFPGSHVSTSAQILDFVKKNLMTVWHASCTCSMKPRRLGGVLDSRLRVYGTQNLRVIDSSSFPALPPGHPQSTIYALAEKGADLIKEDHRRKTWT